VAPDFYGDVLPLGKNWQEPPSGLLGNTPNVPTRSNVGLDVVAFERQRMLKALRDRIIP
jgi:hypothetical protein